MSHTINKQIKHSWLTGNIFSDLASVLAWTDNNKICKKSMQLTYKLAKSWTGSLSSVTVKSEKYTTIMTHKLCHLQ